MSHRTDLTVIAGETPAIQQTEPLLRDKDQCRAISKWIFRIFEQHRLVFFEHEVTDELQGPAGEKKRGGKLAIEEKRWDRKRDHGHTEEVCELASNRAMVRAVVLLVFP